MKNSEVIREPLVNIERSPLFVLIALVISTLLVYFTYLLFVQVNPWAFLMMVPASVAAFQSVWFLLHPFALVFDDHVEYKQSLFTNKVSYFTDVKKVNKSKKAGLYITYTDDEQESLPLFGIRAAHVDVLMAEIEKRIISRNQA